MTAIPTDQTLHTSTMTNLASSMPLGQIIFDVDGSKTFNQVGNEVFTQTISNQTRS